MKHYLSDLIPRLKKYSATLDQSAFLVDKPWVVADNDNSYEKLIFRSDGRVHLSTDGNVTTGEWEYLPEAQSLIINYGNREILYRHQYLDKAVLALKKDGKMKEGDYYLLANEQEIPDLKVKEYLNNKYLSENNVKVLALDNGSNLYITDDGFIPKVSSPNGEEVKNGIYTTKDDKYHIKDGAVTSKFQKFKYNNITIWQKYSSPSSGDIVENISTGSHIVKDENGEKCKLEIKDNKVIKVKFLMGINIYEAVIIFVIVVLLLTAILLSFS